LWPIVTLSAGDVYACSFFQTVSRSQDPLSLSFLGSGIHVKGLQLILNPSHLKDCATGLAEAKRLKVYTDESMSLARDKGDVSALAMSKPCYSTNFLISRNRCFEELGGFFLVADEGGQPI
jgi:hypothetical protein